MARRRAWCHTGWDLLHSNWSDEINSQFDHLDIPADPIIDQRAFLENLKELCRGRKQNNYMQFGQRLQFHNIDILVRNSDKFRRNNVKESFASFVYTATFLSLLRNSQGPLKLQEIVDLLSTLNSKVPNLTSDLWNNFNEEAQSNVRKIYNEYMSFLIDTITQLDSLNTSSRSDASEEPISGRVRRLSESLEPLGQRFATLANSAMHSVSTSSVISGASHDSLESGLQEGRQLGHGSYGFVTEYKELSTGFLYAKKTIRLPPYGTEREAAKIRAQKEYMIMDSLRHDHIVRVCVAVNGEDHFSFYMRPVADMDLGKFLTQCSGTAYPPQLLSDLATWYGCLSQALAYAHRHNIQHNDIKPSNILVMHDRGSYRVWLTDFGLARDLTELSARPTYSVRGTSIYLAPEIRPGHTPGAASDVYSLGCVFAEMLSVLCGKSIDDFKQYRTNNGIHAFRDNEALVTNWLAHLPIKSFQEGSFLRSVTQRMLQADPQSRDDAEVIATSVKSRRASATPLSCGAC